MNIMEKGNEIAFVYTQWKTIQCANKQTSILQNYFLCESGKREGVMWSSIMKKFWMYLPLKLRRLLMDNLLDEFYNYNEI